MKSLTRLLNKRRRRIVGLMSGTSADGVDAAVVEVESIHGPAGGVLSWELVDFRSTPYPPAVRAEILAVQSGEPRLLERLTRLHFILGHLFADAVQAAIREAGLTPAEIDAVASHGQTVCHFPHFPDAAADRDGAGAASWGRPARGREDWVSASTLQIGEPAVIAERTGLPVIADFRARDVAAGGTGAPLVPIVDHALFAHPERARLVLNVGGIANFTAIPAGASPAGVTALDTGPGMMVLDALMDALTEGEKRVDEGGGLAAKGMADDEAVAEAMADPYFAKAPPKAAGRGEFGDAFARRFLEACRKRKLSEASTLASGAELTARSIHDAYRRFVSPGFTVNEVIVSGGGAHHVGLLRRLSDLFEGASLVTSDYYGLDVDAKEAVAFALLAQMSLEGEPGNLPEVTGATHPVILGTITPGGGGS
jgi:anhydro-N-acetylmuramic acid kinase